MAIIRVDSHATGAANGTSWADAYLSISDAVGAGPGSQVWVASDHVEPDATVGMTIDFSAGTWDDPVVLISIDKSDDSYETQATGGGYIFNTTSWPDFTLQGYIIAYGIKAISNNTGTQMTLGSFGENCRFYDCHFETPSYLAVYGAASARLTNCTLILGYLYGWYSQTVEVRGCTITCSSTSYAIGGNSYHCVWKFIGCDFSASSYTSKIVDLHETDLRSRFDFIGCKLAQPIAVDDYTGAVWDSHINFESCTHVTSYSDPLPGLTYYKSVNGTILPEIGLYRNATDGVRSSPYSIKMTSNSKALENTRVLDAPPIVGWVSSGIQDITIYVTCDIQLMTNDFFVEVLSPSEGSPVDGLAHWQTKKPSPVDDGTTPLAADTSGIWVAAKNYEQKVVVSINPTLPGPVQVVCCLARPSTDVWVDPILEIAQP